MLGIVLCCSKILQGPLLGVISTIQSVRCVSIWRLIGFELAIGSAVLILQNSERNPPPSVSEGGKFFLSFDHELRERLKCGKSEWETRGGLAGDSRGTR